MGDEPTNGSKSIYRFSLFRKDEYLLILWTFATIKVAIEIGNILGGGGGMGGGY